MGRTGTRVTRFLKPAWLGVCGATLRDPDLAGMRGRAPGRGTGPAGPCLGRLGQRVFQAPLPAPQPPCRREWGGRAASAAPGAAPAAPRGPGRAPANRPGQRPWRAGTGAGAGCWGSPAAGSPFSAAPPRKAKGSPSRGRPPASPCSRLYSPRGVSPRLRSEVVQLSAPPPHQARTLGCEPAPAWLPPGAPPSGAHSRAGLGRDCARAP